jgi:hypothetical protein
MSDSPSHPDAWFVYAPHWRVRARSVLVSTEETFMKTSTAYSWDLTHSEKRAVPEGTSIQIVGFPEIVTDPVEQERHEWTHLHRRVILTPASARALFVLPSLEVKTEGSSVPTPRRAAVAASAAVGPAPSPFHDASLDAAEADLAAAQAAFETAQQGLGDELERWRAMGRPPRLDAFRPEPSDERVARGPAVASDGASDKPASPASGRGGRPSNDALREPHTSDKRM